MSWVKMRGVAFAVVSVHAALVEVVLGDDVVLGDAEALYI